MPEAAVITRESRELAELRKALAERDREIEELEEEIERLEHILFTHESYVIEGYVVDVWPDESETFLATCGKLHAMAQESTKERALESVREAMDVVREGMASVGREIPPPDVA